MTVIAIRPHRWEWKVFEAAVGPVFPEDVKPSTMRKPARAQKAGEVTQAVLSAFLD
jgi:hypothetical protein